MDMGEILERIQQALKQVETNQRTALLSRIAGLQAKAGHYEHAIQTALQIPNPDLGAMCLSRIALHQAKYGHPSQARRTFQHAIQRALQHEDKEQHSIIVGGIANSQAEVGLFEEAFQTLSQADMRASSQGLVLARIAIRQSEQVVQAKRIVDLARRLAVQIQSAHERNYAYEAIARSLAKVGNIDEALQVALQIETSQCYFMRARALEGVVHSLVTSGQKERALQIAEQFSDQPYEHACMLIQIAEVLVNLPH